MKETVMPEPITRPNGSIYRPRKLRTQVLGDCEEPTSIVVFGTTDQRDARALAEQDVRAMCLEFDYTDPAYAVAKGLGKPVWWRRELGHFEDDSPVYRYSVDEERGAYGVLFDLDPAETFDQTRDGLPARPYDTPLWSNDADA